MIFHLLVARWSISLFVTDCQSVKDFYLVNIDNVDTQVAWFQWETIDKKVQKIEHEGTIAELIDCLAKQWNTFLAHCYVKDVQSSYYEKLKRKLSPNESVVQVDFSENYQTFHQDETQAAYWAYNQITLFTCCVWTAKGIRSVCFISDYLNHDKYSVHVYIDKLISLMKSENEHLTSVSIFSDGSAAQFKNRFLFANMHWFKMTHELEHYEWNFFATSHGKGPVDGLGGSLMRMVRRAVLGRKLIVANAEHFVQACKNSTAKVVFVTTEEVLEKKDFLNQRWENVSTLRGTQLIHHLVPSGPFKISYSRVSQGMSLISHKFSTPGNDSPESCLKEIQNQVESSSTDDVTASCSKPQDGLDGKLKVGDFVIANLASKRSKKSYVGQAILFSMTMTSHGSQLTASYKNLRVQVSINLGSMLLQNIWYLCNRFYPRYIFISVECTTL